MLKSKRKKVNGIALELEIAKSNLIAKSKELDRIVGINSDLTHERDFLRKVILNLSVKA